MDGKLWEWRKKIPEIFWILHGIFPEMFRRCFENFPEIFWKFSGNVRRLATCLHENQPVSQVQVWTHKLAAHRHRAFARGSITWRGRNTVDGRLTAKLYFSPWKLCFLAITHNHQVRFMWNRAEMNPTSLPELFKSSGDLRKSHIWGSAFSKKKQKYRRKIQEVFLKTRWTNF